ncbi:hypothetical protein N1851_000115 [Merluccius polli]|uniref:Uncharacterized protein n=1 Tax=Merluccius polli TaxID=89951 RepID=A0AA47NDM8_MERPO|nr:hypothetical protein N1851_000115 [Merluccius polli]
MAIIVRALPNLSEDTQMLLILSLQSSGLESKEDLKYVQKEDVADLLPVIQVRKLLDAFNPTPTLSPSPLESTSSPSATSSSDLSDLSSPINRRLPPQISTSWPEKFQVPWDRMPLEIRSAIANGKRPTPAERRQMVKVLVDEIRKCEANPTRSQCLTVKTRIENINRESSFTSHQTSRASGSSSGHKRGPTDTYGCTRFQPELPPGETDDTVEQKCTRLEEIYSQEVAGGIQRAEVSSLMETTFYLLNAFPAPSTEDIRSKWPYLFNQRCIYAHFELLCCMCCVSWSFPWKNEYFQSKPTNKDVQTVFSQSEGTDVALLVVQLLMAHFTETTDALILLADVSATVDDVEKTLTLPPTPRGTERVTTGRWMISLEGHVQCEGIQPTFMTGLAALFSLYHIFNLQYQEDAACTLEFIQRRFIGINPERGSKASWGKIISKKTGKVVQKMSHTFNPHVSTLPKNLMDFESCIGSKLRRFFISSALKYG